MGLLAPLAIRISAISWMPNCSPDRLDRPPPAEGHPRPGERPGHRGCRTSRSPSSAARRHPRSTPCCACPAGLADRGLLLRRTRHAGVGAQPARGRREADITWDRRQRCTSRTTELSDRRTAAALAGDAADLAELREVRAHRLIPVFRLNTWRPLDPSEPSDDSLSVREPTDQALVCVITGTSGLGKSRTSSASARLPSITTGGRARGGRPRGACRYPRRRAPRRAGPCLSTPRFRSSASTTKRGASTVARSARASTQLHPRAHWPARPDVITAPTDTPRGQPAGGGMGEDHAGRRSWSGRPSPPTPGGSTPGRQHDGRHQRQDDRALARELEHDDHRRDRCSGSAREDPPIPISPAPAAPARAGRPLSRGLAERRAEHGTDEETRGGRRHPEPLMPMVRLVATILPRSSTMRN